jgi:hypothetical protein
MTTAVSNEVTPTVPVAPATIPSERVVAAPPKLSWGALLGSAFFVLGVFALLLSIGLAIGLSSVDPNDPSTVKGAWTGIGVWSAIASFIALFLGGLLSSRTAGIADRTVGALHGAVLWGLTTVATFMLLGSMAWGLASGVAKLGAGVVSAGGAAVGATAAKADQIAASLGIGTDDLMNAVNQRLRAEGKPPVTADQVQAAAQDVARDTLTQGRIDRNMFVRSLADKTSLSQAGAREIVDRVERTFNQRTQQLTQSAETTALKAMDETGHAMWWVFIGLLIGLGSSVAGGALGVTRAQRIMAERVAPPPPVATTTEAHA